jgi:hypothetical protein
MPWSESDGPERHTKKANTPARKKRWAAVANRVLERTGDEAVAIREANSVIKGKYNKRAPRAN